MIPAPLPAGESRRRHASSDTAPGVKFCPGVAAASVACRTLVSFAGGDEPPAHAVRPSADGLAECLQ